MAQHDPDPPAPRPPEPAPADLRQRALGRLQTQGEAAPPADADSDAEASMRRTLHELRVHQIELEMQNEELRRAQQALEEARQRWFELFDLAPVGYCTLSAGGDIQMTNLAAADLLGEPRAELVRRRFAQLLQAADQPVFRGLLERLVTAGEAASCELRLAARSAAPRWVQLTATAFLDEQGRRSFRLVMVDVTARRQAEAAEAALRLADQASRQRSELLSRVSHEFRTPLNAILGFSHLMLQDVGRALPDSARRPLEYIADAGNHLLQLVTDLLDISRLGSGQLALRIAHVDLASLLQEAVRAVGPQARAAAVNLVLDLGPTPPPGVLADPTRLRQVLLNLLSNAVKYNRRGGRVSVQTSRHGEACRVHIVDNGLGMSAEQQAALFQPFNRLGREAEGYEGTGLGLVIARDLVQAMGGRLGVHSALGVGSEFTVDLPVSGLAAQPAAAGPISALPQDDRIRGRVLCVEDDLPSQALLRETLAMRPALALDMAGTGAAAIAAARRQWPDLLILDQSLPDMSGLDVLKVLRQLNPQLALPCLVVSAQASAEDMARARTAGATACLAKPCDPARLLAQVDMLLGGAG